MDRRPALPRPARLRVLGLVARHRRWSRRWRSFPSFVKKPYVAAHEDPALPRRHPGRGLERHRRLRRPVLGRPRRLLRHRRLHRRSMLLQFNQIAPWWGIWAGDRERRCWSRSSSAASPSGCAAPTSCSPRSRWPRSSGSPRSTRRTSPTAPRASCSPTSPPCTIGGTVIDFVTKGPSTTSALALAVVTIAANWLVQHSKLGYYFQAIREDQDAAHSLGINLDLLQERRAGHLRGLHRLGRRLLRDATCGFIDPNTVFGLDISVQIVLICIIGGIGTILGPVIGAMVLVPLSEVLAQPARASCSSGSCRPDSGDRARSSRRTSPTPTCSSTASSSWSSSSSCPTACSA